MLVCKENKRGTQRGQVDQNLVTLKKKGPFYCAGPFAARQVASRPIPQIFPCSSPRQPSRSQIYAIFTSDSVSCFSQQDARCILHTADHIDSYRRRVESGL